jgi:hypothetical protein
MWRCVAACPSHVEPCSGWRANAAISLMSYLKLSHQQVDILLPDLYLG